MIFKHNERVMVFIDLRNLLRSAEPFEELGLKININEIVEKIVDGRKHADTYVFDSIKFNGLYEDIHYKLMRLGFRVVTRKGYDPDKKEQKEIDVAMTCEIVSQAYKDGFDTAVIVSGDRDFRPVIELIQSMGKRAEVAGFSDDMSKKLRNASDAYHNLDPMSLKYYQYLLSNSSDGHTLKTLDVMYRIQQFREEVNRCHS